VDELLNHLDEHATLQQPLIFSGFELTCNHKHRYRICGIDVHTGHTHVAPSQQSLTKAIVEKVVSSIPVVKGKFEHELQFAFIQEGMELVPEDAIFSGDNKIYAEMRCRLRKCITREAQRFNVQGPGGVIGAA